jgi:hypothetical protein
MSDPTAGSSHVDRFHWFPEETVAQLLAQIEEYGAERLEVRQHGDAMYLRVVGRLGQGPDLNESRLCPPICP